MFNKGTNFILASIDAWFHLRLF